MVVSLNGQWEIDGLLVGTGTLFPVDTVSGMGQPEAKVFDFDTTGRDGWFSGTDRLGVRDVTLAFGVKAEADSAELGAGLDDLGEIFNPRGSDVLVRYQRFDRVRRFYARPRGLIVPWDFDFHLGASKPIGRLLSLSDPVIYDEDVTQTGPASATFDVENEGRYPVWPIIDLSTVGSTVSLVNNTDEGKSVVLEGLGGDTTVDFARRVVTTGVLDAYSSVAAGPLWWRLLPGVNSLTITGAQGLVEFRNGWATG